MNVEERLLEKIEINGKCWLWTASVMANGYPRLAVDGKACGAHRVSYELFIGSIPEGMELHHLCHTKACVNPEHLVPIVRADHRRLHRKTHCNKGHELAVHGVKRGDDLLRCGICFRAYHTEWRRSRCA